MDAFSSLAAFLDIDTTTDTPANQDGGGGGNTIYCVTFAKEDLPTNEDGGGGGNTIYCVVA